jgi:tetratricopeptide (TPR) repeat protein
MAGYERFRQAIIAHVADAVYPFTDRIIKISLLRPADEKMLKALEPLAEEAGKSFATNVNADGDVFLAAWRSVSLGLMEYRRGDYTKAAAWCQRCLNYSEYNAPRAATARVILAMACQQLGQSDEARSELAQGRKIIEDKFQSGLDRGTGVQGFWFDWLFGRILLGEATALIEGTPQVIHPQ